MAEIEEMIRTYIADNMLFSDQGYPYADDVSFLENGIIDSMNMLELVVLAEEKFGLKVDDNEIIPENFDSVRRLSDFIRRKSPLKA